MNATLVNQIEYVKVVKLDLSKYKMSIQAQLNEIWNFFLNSVI